MLTIVEFHELVASWALSILETDCVGVWVNRLSLGLGPETESMIIICKPFLLDFSLYTIKVKDMFATKLDDYFLPEPLNVTYRAI